VHCPGHTAAGEAMADITGLGLTVTVTVALAVQPAVIAPVTVYVVVPVGQTFTVTPLRPPGIQL